MKKAFLVFACALTALGIAAYQFRPATLSTASGLAIAIPDARPPAALTLAVLYTGAIAAKAGLAYRGGDLREERAFAMSAVLVRHPQGDLLIDAGFVHDRRVMDSLLRFVGGAP